MARMRFGIKDAKAIGLGGKIFGTLFLGAFLAGGVFFFGLLSKEIWQTIQTYRWKPADCTILASEVVRAESRDSNPYEFRVRFEYVWNGRTHTQDQAGLKKQRFGSYNEAQELANRFPAGRASTCRVNPDQPTQAILVRGSFLMVPFLIIPIVFIVIGGGGIVALWMAKTGDAAGDSAADQGPISEKAVTKSGAGCLVFFFAIFLLMGSGFFYGFFIRPALRILDAADWVETPCVVESSELRSHRGDDGTTYSVDILYRYSVDGREYRSSRYHFMGGSTGGYSGKQDIVRRHPPGRETICFVNPANPNEAVLVRGWTPEMWFGLIPLVFVAVGLIGIIFALRKARTAGAVTSPISRGAPAAGVSSVATPSPLNRGSGLPATHDVGPADLKSRGTPLGKLIAVIFFALFWNGIVSVFVVQVIKGWQRGGGGFMEKWFLPVFLIPFVLIGLGLIGAVFYQFLVLFNARPRLRVSSRTVRLGDAMDLEWRLEGRTGPVERLRISLKGKEEATYRRGTDTRTDSHLFADVELVSTSVRGDMLSGSTRFTVPADTMHSFQADHNKITWTLHVEGTIRKWPDISEEFDMQVLPQARRASAQDGGSIG